MSDMDNYFGIYDSPVLESGTEGQFTEWESLLQALDSQSFMIFLDKATRYVTKRHDTRGWDQLVACMNEVRGYEYALALGYTNARLLANRSQSYPDVEASKADEKCLMEVKTIQKSDFDIDRRGRIQTEELGLPKGLKDKFRGVYSKACRQILGRPWNGQAKRICYMVINVDLRTALADENKALLDGFLDDLQTEVEIHWSSTPWTARITGAKQETDPDKPDT